MPVGGAVSYLIRMSSLIRSADDGSNGSYVSDLQETVISKDRPVVQSSSNGENVTIIAGTPKQLGEMLEGATLEHLKLEKFVGGGFAGLSAAL